MPHHNVLGTPSSAGCMLNVMHFLVSSTPPLVLMGRANHSLKTIADNLWHINITEPQPANLHDSSRCIAGRIYIGPVRLNKLLLIHRLE